jgi:hypothetical protein
MSDGMYEQRLAARSGGTARGGLLVSTPESKELATLLAVLRADFGWRRGESLEELLARHDASLADVAPKVCARLDGAPLTLPCWRQST